MTDREGSCKPFTHAEWNKAEDKNIETLKRNTIHLIAPSGSDAPLPVKLLKGVDCMKSEKAISRYFCLSYPRQVHGNVIRELLRFYINYWCTDNRRKIEEEEHPDEEIKSQSIGWLLDNIDNRDLVDSLNFLDVPMTGTVALPYE